MVDRASTIIYVLQISFVSSVNLIFALLKERKSILKTTFMLPMLANKKILQKIESFLSYVRLKTWSRPYYKSLVANHQFFGL